MNIRLGPRTRNWIILLVIALVAVVLRLYAIDRLPPGLFGDEAVEGLDALDVLAGNFAIWFHAHLGREPLFVYLVAASYRAFGVSPLSTRLPAIVAGLLTVPAAFLFAREWARHVFGEGARAFRIAVFSTALIAISFWHIQMTRDAHRTTLLPLVESIGFWLLWRGVRMHDWKNYAASGAVLGMAIYTYSPGRFVALLVALFFAVELLVSFAIWRAPSRQGANAAPVARMMTRAVPLELRSLGAAAVLAILVMLPLGIYFAQNPVQFSRRFESVSVLDADSPQAAFAASVSGNLAQFVIPGAGYQSKHYNLPGKPIFDLFIAPWFIAGFLLALTRLKHPGYRFLLLWFLVMLLPAFLTADMIPKAVRAFGVVPGVFIFPALAINNWLERFSGWRRRFTLALIGLSLLGSTAWTAYDYFVAWANLPELPLAFDADLTEVSTFMQSQPVDPSIYISTEVYRPPTEMLLGRLVPTTRYVDQATRIKEFDATSSLLAGDPSALYIFVRDRVPPQDWLARLVLQSTRVGEGVYFDAFLMDQFAPPQKSVTVSFNPLLTLTGYSRFTEDPTGIVLYWQVAGLPADRQDMDATLALLDARSAEVTQDRHRFGVAPLEWGTGDRVIEWYPVDLTDNAIQFTIRLQRGESNWLSPALPLR